MKISACADRPALFALLDAPVDGDYTLMDHAAYEVELAPLGRAQNLGVINFFGRAPGF